MKIEQAPRDLADQVIFVIPEQVGAQSIFFRHEKNVVRLGMPTKNFKQVCAILFQGLASQAELAEFYPEKDRKIDRPNNLRSVNRRFLAAVDNKRFDTLDKCGVRYLRQGWIRVNRFITENGVVRPSPLHVPDIDAAIRMEGHILDYYGGTENKPGEFAELTTFDAVIRTANNLLVVYKNSSIAKREVINEQLVRVILRLEHCRNDEKVEVFEQLREVAAFEDSLGRVNPGAFAARTVAALNRLASRFQEMRIIQPIIALRRELLIFEKRSFEYQEKQVGIMLRNLIHRIYNDSGAVKNLEGNFGRILYFTGFLWPSPFYERGKWADAHLLAGKKAARLNQADKALYNLMAAHHIINNHGLLPKKPF